MLIHLPNERSIVVDANTAGRLFRRLTKQRYDSKRTDAGHARQLREHVKALSAKAYWHQLSSPEFVVLFIPANRFLARPGTGA